MHSVPKLQLEYLRESRAHRDRRKTVPTLCISAPDDVYQENRDALWSFQTRYRGPNSVIPDELNKLYPEDPILRHPRTVVVTNTNRAALTYRHQFQGRNFTMGSDNGKRYNFDLPDVTPKINARFNQSKRVIPSIKAPSVVGTSMNLKPQSSYSSFEYQSDEDDEHDTGNGDLENSLTYGNPDYGLSSIVIRSLQSEREHLLTSSGEETPPQITADNVIEAVEKVNRSLGRKSYSETFINVPTADSHFIQPLEISSGISKQDKQSIKYQEREAGTTARNRYSKPKRKSKRRSKHEPVLFSYNQLGSSSSVQTDTHSDCSIMEDDNQAGRYSLDRLLDNYVAQCSDIDDRSDELLQEARNQFNVMVNTKEVLNESLYDEFARFNERANQIRRDSTLLSVRPTKGDELGADENRKIRIKWK